MKSAECNFDFENCLPQSFIVHDSHNSSLSTFDSKGSAGCSKSPCLLGMNGFSEMGECVKSHCLEY